MSRTRDRLRLTHECAGMGNDDQSECIVLERYRDSEALIEDLAHLGDLSAAILATGSVSGELLGEPSVPGARGDDGPADQPGRPKIKASGIPFPMRAPQEFAARLSSVLHVLYLLFNEGYTSSAGADLHRTDLSGEAIRLTRALHAMLPQHSEVTGLLALMLLNDARPAAARTAS
jgi:hypothetical protein